MSMMGRGTRVVTALLLMLMVASQVGCQQGRLKPVTRAVGAAIRFRHALGVTDHQHTTSLAPHTTRPPPVPRAWTPQQDTKHSGDSQASEAVQRKQDLRDEQDPEGTGVEVPPNPESRGAPHEVLRPEIPRVPQLPEHLPPGLASRLNEFPSPLDASGHAFFQPRIQVEAEELDDAEWEQLLAEGWARDGVVPGLLPAAPPYLANVNYGDHQCVHLGNTITPAHARAPPNSLRFPGEEGRRYSVMLLDVDAASPPRLLWLLINAPARQPRQGVEAVEYEAPRPSLDTGQHRLVFLVYRQRAALRSSDARVPRARACQNVGRDHVDLTRFAADLELDGPTAANYFLSEWDVTVEHTCTTPGAS